MEKQLALVTGEWVDWVKPSVSSFVDAGHTVAVTYSPNNAGVERWLARMVADGRQFRAYAVDVGDRTVFINNA